MEENEVDVQENVQEITPYEYFMGVKDKVQTMNDERLASAYRNAIRLAEKYNKTGQKKALRKLKFHIESIVKEKKVLEAGINKFVYKSDIEEYIQEVASKQVVILDLASFERDMPDEIVEALEKVKDIFDEFYVVCTDYTGKVAKQVNKERREKDPILFGAFLDRNRNAINERFYYIGDWIDEYCDLTLDKMVAEMKEEKDKDIINEIYSIPETKEELQSQLNSLKLEEDDDRPIKLTKVTTLDGKKENKGIFSKIKTFLGKKND